MRQGHRLENTIPWGFKLPEVESGVRLRPPLEESLDALMERVPKSERTSVMERRPKPTIIPPPSKMMNNAPPVPRPPRPMSSAPPPPPAAMIVPPSVPPAAMMHPSIIPAVQALTVATACGWIVPPTSASAPPMPAQTGFGWRLYVLVTTGLMAALATSVLFLTGHASAMTRAPAASAPPVINVNVPPAPAAPAPSVVASASASAAPKAPVHAAAPRPAPSSSAKPAPAPVVSNAPAPSAAPPPTPAPPSTQAQETADMLREQLGAAVH